MSWLFWRSYWILGTLFLTSCQTSAISYENKCPIEEPHTYLELAGYQVKIFRPNDIKSPDIWQGPLCIKRMVKQVYCQIDVSLIKEIKYESSAEQLVVTTFSGSNQEKFKIDVDACKFVRF